MSPTDLTLIDRWIDHRDAEAFQEIVTRHGAMVFGTCARILRNGSDAEEITQECFLKLAETENNSIQKLGGWLHKLATHRSLNRLRSEGRLQDREKRYAEAGPTHVDESWDDTQAYVDEAILELPEELSVVIVRHFLEGHSKKAIADELGLSPSSITRRIDRAVLEIREHLSKNGVTTASAAVTSLLGNLLSSEIPKALASSLGKLALSGRKLEAAASIGSGKVVGFPMGLKIGVGVSILAIAIAFSLIQFKAPSPNVEGPPSAEIEVAQTVDDTAFVETVPPEVSSTPNDVARGTADAEKSTISGKVVYKRTNRHQRTAKPADDVRVLMGRGLGTDDELLYSVVTGGDGTFTLSGVQPGKYGMVAYDARYDEVPEDWLRSEHVLQTVKSGIDITNVELEVPPRGGQVFGRVIDEKNRQPMSGITISASRSGSSFYEGTTDSNGEYMIVGLVEGDWRVRVADENPIFSSDSINTMTTIHLKHEGRAEVDLELNTGIPISGRAELDDGSPFQGRIVAELYPENGDNMGCYFNTDSEGRFTFLGANAGDRAVIRAERRDLASHIVNVFPMRGEPIQPIVLTVFPRVKVSGHFVDTKNGAINGLLWYRRVQPDGADGWRGQVDAGKRFEISLAPGTYEIKGVSETYELANEQVTKTIEVTTSPLSNLILTIRTSGTAGGVFSLSGRVVEETGKAVRYTRVTLRGNVRDNPSFYSQTQTDSNGRFSFEGLEDSSYEVRANVNDPYERNPGFYFLNPIDNPEIEIVARKAPRLAGQVVDASTDKPIKKFSIEVGQALQMGNEAIWEKKGLVSESGEFNVPAQLDKDWFARIEADGFATLTLYGDAFTSGDDVEKLTFELREGRIVSGSVVDEGNQPIKGVFLFLNEDAYNNHVFHNNDNAAATTNSDGEFIIRSIPSDSAHVYAAKEGFAVKKLRIAETLTFKLTNGGTLEGTLFIGGDVAPEKTTVYVSHSKNRRFTRSGQTGPDGHFEIDALLVGKYHLQTYLSGNTADENLLVIHEELIEVDVGMTSNVDFSIPGGNSIIEGTLREGGVFVPDWFVQAKFGGVKVMGKTDQDGRFRFENLPAGNVVIERYVPSREVPGTWAQEEIAEIVIGAGETVHQDIDVK